MRVLVITNLYPRPGRETIAAFNRQQFRALAAEHEVVVVAPVPWTEAVRGRGPGYRAGRWYTNADGLRVCHPTYYFPPRVLRHRYGEFYLASVRGTVSRLLAGWRPDVVLGSWAHPDGWAAVKIARENGLPVMIKVLGSDIILADRDARRRVRIAEALREADGVVAVSRDLARRVVDLGADPGRVHLVSEGLNGALFHPGDRGESRARLGLPAGGVQLLFVGNILLSKGAGVLVEACGLLAGRGVDFTCRLVGGGRDEARVRALVARHGLAGRVALVGPRPHAELPDWYRSCDVMVLPSFSEGIPNVLRESVACGRPFVASDVGGIPEIADPAYCRLVPPGSPSRLADALVEVLGWEVDAAEVARRSGSISWDESARLLAERLRTVVEERMRSPGLPSNAGETGLTAPRLDPAGSFDRVSPTTAPSQEQAR